MNCKKCTISPFCYSKNQHIVWGDGNLKSKIMVVGEAPGANEDKEGKPFVGLSGKLLDKIILEAGLNREDLFITNTIKCRPYKINVKTGRIVNRPPSANEIQDCKSWLWKEILQIQPNIIIMVGKVAVGTLMQKEKFSMKDYFTPILASWHSSIYLIGCWHPSFLLRKGKKEFDEAVNSFKLARKLT